MSVLSGLIIVPLFLIGLIPISAEASRTESPIYRLRVHYSTQNIQGTRADIPVSLETTLDTGRTIELNLRLKYDHIALLLTEIIPSDTERVSWEYFQSDFWKRDDTNDTVAPGIIQIKARGRLRWAYPEEFPDSARPFPLFVIRTLITNDRTYECRLARIDWLWNSCEDNVPQIDNTETKLISRLVLDSIYRCEIQDSTVGYPTRLGAQAHCQRLDGGRTERLIDFVNGGPELVCFGSIDTGGDLNLNGIGFDSADYALYNDMLLNGIDSIGSDNPQGTIAASELNGDGTPLTISDMIYMKRVIVGDALPCPLNKRVDTTFLVLNDEYLSLSTQDTVGGLYLKMAGRFEPELLRTDVALSYSIEDDTTRILILAREPDTTAKLTTGPLLRILPARKRMSVKRVIEAQASTIWGCYIQTNAIAASEAKEVERDTLPATNQQGKDWPNPFSPTCDIRFDAPKMSYAEMSIFDASGHLVRAFRFGILAAGEYFINCPITDEEGSSITSGIYFYRLTIGTETETRKFVLLK